jgi:hypothetical protein
MLVYVNGSLLTSLTILRERLDLCCLDSSTSYPDCTLDYDCGNHSKDGCRRKICNFVLATRKKLLDGFLQDLQKRDNHENREDQDTKRLKAAPAHGELLPQTSESPTYELVRRPDDQCAEKIERRIDQGCDERKRVGPDCGDSLGSK